MRFNINHIKIKKKLLLSFSIVIMLLAVNIVVSVFQLRHISQDTEEMQKKYVLPLETLEIFKADFINLRVMVRGLITDATISDAETVNKSVETARRQYDKLQIDAQNHIDRLVKADMPLSDIDEARLILLRVNNEYWPIAEKIIQASLVLDIDSIKAAVTEAGVAAQDIEDDLNELFEVSMSLSTQQSNATIDIVQQSLIQLIILGLLAMGISVTNALYIGGSIAARITALAAVAADIAEGRLDHSLANEEKDEIGDLTRRLGAIKDKINKVISGIQLLTQEFAQGQIYIKIDTTELSGAYKIMSEDINKLYSTVISDIITLMGCVSTFAEGDFNADIAEYPGDKKIMNVTLNSLRDTLTSIVNDAGKLVGAAAEGNLTERIAVERYRGDWVRIMEALNRLMTVVSTPIMEAEQVLAQVAQGCFDKNITGEYQGSFLLIKKSVNNMVTHMNSYINEISDVISALADNDLNQEIKREYVGKFAEIKYALNHIFDRLNHVITDILNASKQVTAGARQIAESSVSLAAGTTEQASAAEELSATIQMINQNTAQNAGNAKEAEHLAKRAKENAVKGDGDMKQMLASMDGIKSSSDSIAKIIKVIDDIAFQTNLLALNASVEAARAGAQGWGFAVVAGEVRRLAVHSQEAALETTGLIEESVKRVNEGMKMADTTALALQTIVNDSEKMASLTGEIARSSEEQAAAIGQVTDGLQQITEVIQKNSTMSEETASASEELSSQSDVLQEMMGLFKLRKM